MLLKAYNLTKSYGHDSERIAILKGIHLSLNAGEKIAIMGPSGSGKSTLLSILSCLDRSDTGELIIANQDIAKLSAIKLNQFRAKHIGVIFQNFHLIDKLTAEENIRLPLDFLGFENPLSRTTQMLKSLGLSHRASHFPYQLSRGEAQRVAIGRVLVTQPEIVLADEPTGSLDLRTAHSIMDLLWQQLPSHSAFLMVTHDPALARRCQRIYSIFDGTLQEASQSAHLSPEL